MSQSDGQYDFIVQEIAAIQPQLYVFVRTLISNPEQARDLLQEVNLILWQKRADYDVERDFGHWARGIARIQAMNFYQNQVKDKHIFFDEKLLGQVAEIAANRSDEVDQRSEALHLCLKKLPEEQRRFIETRYFDKKAVKAIAQQEGRSPGAVAKVLFRARQALLKCMRLKMTREQS